MKLRSRPFRHFWRDEDGNLVVELLLIFPMLVWAYATLYSFWDAYRTTNTVQKAAYTVSDLLSRQQGKVNDTYIDGLRQMMDYQLDSDQHARLRVTSFRWSDINRQFQVIWSRSPQGTQTPLTTATLMQLSNRLPEMADGDTAMLLEAEVPYEPTLDFGLEPMTLKQFIVTRPRWLPCILHENVGPNACL